MYDILVNSAGGDIPCVDEDDNDAIPVATNGSNPKCGSDSSRIMLRLGIFRVFCLRRSVFDQSTTTSSEGPEDVAEQRKKRRMTSTSTAQVTESDKNESQNNSNSQC
jgi:hypothetical protein